MNELHVLVDCRGDDRGAAYHVCAGFSYIDALELYYKSLVADYPDLAKHLYRRDIQSMCTKDNADVFIVGNNDGPTVAFTELDLACDYMKEHPENALYIFIVPYDPRYA
jgi:hypothetical protein